MRQARSLAKRGTADASETGVGRGELMSETGAPRSHTG
jgi:hypothetical protein